MLMKGVVICAVPIMVVIAATPMTVFAVQSDAVHDHVRQVNFQEGSSTAIQAYQKHQTEDAQVQQMALQTVATMANNLVSIGADPYNPQVIGTGIINIVGSFVNFLAAAMRHPEIIDLY